MTLSRSLATFEDVAFEGEAEAPNVEPIAFDIFEIREDIVCLLCLVLASSVFFIQLSAI